MKNEIARSTTKGMNEFNELFMLGERSIQQACEVYVKTIDLDKSAYKEFEKMFPTVPKLTWTCFEKIGRKQQIFQLLTDLSPAAQKITHFPYSVQERAYGQPVELLTKNCDTLKVAFHDLTKEQARQVFTKDHVRTIAEQRAWIENGIKGLESSNPKEEKLTYEVKNGLLIVLDKCSFNKDQLIKILADL